VGELTVGQVQAVKILETMYEKYEILHKSEPYDFVITDSAPGAHCDVEYVLKQSEYVLAVTEPTPFGQHDLERILRLSDVVDRNPYVIVNRSTISNFPLKHPSIASIPYDQQIMESYAQGIPFICYEHATQNSQSLQSIQKIGQFVLNKEV
jgi:MinD superfamily P-loop ATPase